MKRILLAVFVLCACSSYTEKEQPKQNSPKQNSSGQSSPGSSSLPAPFRANQAIRKQIGVQNTKARDRNAAMRHVIDGK